jgi:hypothetical protein
MDFQPCDITDPPRVLGSDLINYLITSAALAGDSDDALRWTRTADVIDPTQWYTGSLDARPDCSVTRWFPPESSGLATVVVFTQAAEITVLIRHGYSGPSSRCP